MRKLRNTLYITKDDMFMNREGDTLVLEQNREKVMQIPILNLEGVVIFSSAAVTPQALELCSENNVHVSYISYTGKFLVKIQNPISGNVALRRNQFRLVENQEESLKLAKNVCVGKVFNSRVVLQRLYRDHKDQIDENAVLDAINYLGQGLKRFSSATNSQELLGIEGDAAKHYYSVFSELIVNDDFKDSFKGRSRRPPLDAVNALLSYFYVLLSHDVTAALETVGLDPQMGFYHKIRSGRSSLALDLMEELRAYLVDRFVVSLINNRVVKKEDFYIKENGAYYLKDELRSAVLSQWQNRKKETITHPYLKEKIEIGLIPYAQALLLVRYIRGDLDAYPPFLMR